MRNLKALLVALLAVAAAGMTAACSSEDEKAKTPTIASVTPLSGPVAGGTGVTIAGENLGNASTVTFGGVLATSVTAASETSVTCVTPAHAAGAVDVVLTTPAGSATRAGGYTYLEPQPTNAKFVGKWRLPEVADPSVGFDVVFNADGTFVAYEMHSNAPKFGGTYTVDPTGTRCAGAWTATSNSRVGEIAAVLENDTTMAFLFIETNAFDNPENVNGRVEEAYHGTRL